MSEKSYRKRVKVPVDSIPKAHTWLPDRALAVWSVQNCGRERAGGGDTAVAQDAKMEILVGFSWWNAAFKNDPLKGGWSNMRVQESPAVRAIFCHYVGAERTVISRPITRLVMLKEP